MGEWQGVDTAGRKIAGLLRYTPPAGFYSRMQRAVEAMPEVIQTREIPGLLRKYPEGVPKWEISTVDVPGIVGDRKTISRQELLDAVQQRSPVFTHGEVMLGGGDVATVSDAGSRARLGEGTIDGPPKYEREGQGGEGYTEILLTQPGVASNSYIPLDGSPDTSFTNHWDNSRRVVGRPYYDAVAHARFDIHGDALRINELQSDLGTHNWKARRKSKKLRPPPEMEPGESVGHYIDRVGDLGYNVQRLGPDGGLMWVDDPRGQVRSFPTEDVWAELLIKRLALEAARRGKPFLEVASPLAVKSKVGGNVKKYEHLYGNVFPGLIERLGRQLGGVELQYGTPVYEGPHRWAIASNTSQSASRSDEALRNAVTDLFGGDDFGLDYSSGNVVDDILSVMRSPEVSPSGRNDPRDYLLGELTHYLASPGSRYATEAEAREAASQALPRLARLAEFQLQDEKAYKEADRNWNQSRETGGAYPVSARYLMSPEMIRNLLERGVPASVLGAAALQRGDE